MDVDEEMSSDEGEQTDEDNPDEETHRKAAANSSSEEEEESNKDAESSEEEDDIDGQMVVEGGGAEDDSNDDEDEDDEEVLTAVVLDEDDDDVDTDDEDTVAVVEAVAVRQESKTTNNKSKNKSHGPKSHNTRTISTVKSTSKPGDSSQKSTRKSDDINDNSNSMYESLNLILDDIDKGPPLTWEELYKDVSSATKEAARDSRGMLRETVPLLPFPIAEMQVRSLGRLCIQVHRESPNGPGTVVQSKYCTSSSLYPIGFSCDRYEFSPVHGRVLKIRCSILDGRAVKAKQNQILQSYLALQQESATPKISKISNVHDGPVFRIMWGQGVDEDPEKNSEHPYNPELHSSPLFVNSKGKLVDASLLITKSERAKPEKGMRVKVRAGQDMFVYGNIIEVTRKRGSEKSSSNKTSSDNKSTSTIEMTVQYDYGCTETFFFPDPDVLFVIPGVDDDVSAGGELELTELNGKPVVSVVGETPLEAWGKVLCKLGLVDEVILKRAFQSLEASRNTSLQEAKDKLEGRFKSKGHFNITNHEKKDLIPEHVQSSNNRLGGSTNTHSCTANTSSNVFTNHQEPPSKKEKMLRLRVQALLSELEVAKEKDYDAQKRLANARIRDIGAFLCNPFHDDESGKSQQLSWLATAVRKEKTRMGSTGNKRKVVTAPDLLERNDTFYTSDIESMIEGLPGSEFCKPYVFQAYRTPSGSHSRSWMHDAQVKNENENLPAQHTSKDPQTEKDDTLESEREFKRRKRDEERDSRKMQKQAEEEERKKARVDERLSRLEIQIKDRLYKEAAFQREKVILVMARSVSKEFSRRRKLAELVTGQAVIDAKKFHQRILPVPEYEPLPSTAKIFDEDTIRVWNFMSTFRSFFLNRSYIQEIPSLDSLQTAINSLRGSNYDDSISRDDAVESLTDLAVALCKPLAASLTRVLFASLIALNPALQKDFGAAFFNEVNSTNSGVDLSIETSGHPDVLLPVNSMTWQEVARLAFLSDALGEMGYSRQEAAHLLRGYRSAGHPNSKESKRLRKTEDYAVSVLRQKITECRESRRSEFFPINRTRVPVPCSPYAVDKLPDKAIPGEWSWLCNNEKKVISEIKQNRLNVGLIKGLHLSSSEYKKLSYEKEQYMEEALKLKEEMERAKRKDDDDEDDEDDDDDEDGAVSCRISTSKEAELTTNTPSDCLGTENESQTIMIDTSTSINSPQVPQKIGKETQYDDFCGDIPSAPEVIRRCLAVLRTLSTTGPAEPFLYPVDPQTNPGYYDNVVRPMCLREAGKQLQEAATKFKGKETCSDTTLGEVVARFGRNVRLIAQNCLAYSNAGPMVTAAGSELLRIFERLFLDWVLAPTDLLPSLENLDDEKCVEHHISDDQNVVLLCDGCEGKYNITRLNPPLREVPAGDWYCPRCVSERCFGKLDHRIGKVIKKLCNQGDKDETIARNYHITRCFFSYIEDEGAGPSLIYEVRDEDDFLEYWSLLEVDRELELSNEPIQSVKWLQAVAESPGYGYGIDMGLHSDLVPVPLNPNITEASAQVALSSSVFRDTLTASATLLIMDPREMTATEWLRLLVLLVMKCSSSDVIQNVVSKMENEAAETMNKPLENVSMIDGIKQVIPPLSVDFEEDDSLEINADEDDQGSDTEKVEKLSCDDGHVSSTTSDGNVSHEKATQQSPCDGTFMSSKPNLPDGAISSSTIAEELNDLPVDVPSTEILTPFMAALNEKGKRQKIVEDIFVAHCVKNQVRPAIASLEEDFVSEAIDSCLSSKDEGLSFSNLRCPQMSCHFCGLTDLAIGLPLVRVPDEHEWEELFSHASRSRRTHLVAEILPTQSNASNDSPRLVSLKVMIGGEFVSFTDNFLDELFDGGMLEFLPRSEVGFQDELLFRTNYDFPYISGSLSAHECCAISAHNTRKDLFFQKFKEHQTELLEKEAGMLCGRTLEIGRDRFGRSYWKFYSLPDTLFVCIECESKICSDEKAGTWYHYTDPASIASLIMSLKKDAIVRDLIRSYPDAAKVAKDGTWSDILMHRWYPNVSKLLTVESTQSQCDDSLKLERSSKLESKSSVYKVGELVLVDSGCSNMIWDAKVMGVSRPREGGDSMVVDAYRVEYKGWGNRFVEWVNAARVCRPTDEKKILQEQKLDERSISKCGLPVSLNFLVAKDYLLARDRARCDAPLPDFSRIAYVKDQRHTNYRTFALMKTALLAIEAALPCGCLDNSDFGAWRPEFSEQWKLLVIDALGPAALMRCFFVLEDVIQPDWIRGDIGHLRACLPDRWKAIGEASPSAVAMRCILLDRSLKYGKVDKKKFANKKSKKKK